MSNLTTALEGYLTTAGTTVTPIASQVRWGEPDVVNLPTIAYWYLGTRTWDANTLNVTQEMQGWMVRILIPIGPRATPFDGNAEQWIADLTDAIRGQLYGHIGAGGNASGQGAEITDAKPGYAQVGQQLCRICDTEVWYMSSNVHTVAV